jgi:very-long-chain enoyl-CoA reductase
MVVGHYIKREYETLFVHRFSNDTMPIFNIFKNCSHYWVLMGLSMFFFLHPDYTQPQWTQGCKYVYYILAGLFTIFEFLNFMCHCTLRDLRPPGTTKRGIPQGWGYGTVSCANYLWEGCAWTTFAIFSNTIFGYIFLIVSGGQMALWALKKQSMYRKDFPDYPRSRKACIPFII